MRNAIVVGIILLVTGSNVWMTWDLWRDRHQPTTPLPRPFITPQGKAPTIRANKIFRPERKPTREASPPWLHIESDNYHEYAANLRAVGCPEKTVRDIIVADIGKIFAEQKRAINDRSQDPFWMTEDQREEIRHERALQETELTLAKWELLRELFVYPIDEEVFKIVRGEGMVQVGMWLAGGFLEREQVIRLIGIGVYFDKQTEAINRRAFGILLEEDYDQARDLRARLKQEAAALVGGAGVEEIFLRLTLAQSDDMGILRYGVNLSGTEIRNLIKIRSAARDLFTEMFAGHGFKDLRSEEVREEEIETAMARYLGRERYEDYTRAKDDRFQGIYTFATENGLSKKEAVAVFDARDRAETELERIKSDQSLDAEQQILLQAAVKTRMESAIQRHFGKIIAQEYRAEGAGEWVDELIETPQPSPTK